MDTSQIRDLAPGTAVHGKGKKRVVEILEAATDILAHEGYSKFTMRHIADRVGVTLRNVQYYFNTKESLFQSVVERWIAHDMETATTAVDNKKLSAEERFLAFIDYSLDENTNPLTRGFQFELWALANHDPFAAKCRDHMTTVYSNFIYDLIKPLTKEQSNKTRREKAVILLSMLQGFPLVEGSDIHIEFAIGNLRKLFRQEALQFVTSTGER